MTANFTANFAPRRAKSRFPKLKASVSVSCWLEGRGRRMKSVSSELKRTELTPPVSRYPVVAYSGVSRCVGRYQIQFVSKAKTKFLPRSEQHLAGQR
ncbi:hypothetical protein BDZ89DRAFT_1083463 [Hymenopellis radicata]|nr:hypothetical protein BDZ89DRAFT_1083463 [Hymenopellis radicata]